MTNREKRIREMIRDCEQARPGAAGYLAIFYQSISQDDHLRLEHLYECPFEMIDEFLADRSMANMRLAGAIALLNEADEPIPGHPSERGIHYVIWPERDDRHEFHDLLLRAAVSRITDDSYAEVARKVSQN